MDLKTFVKYILDRATPEGAHFSSDHGKTERESLPLGTEERERERERMCVCIYVANLFTFIMNLRRRQFRTKFLANECLAFL